MAKGKLKAHSEIHAKQSFALLLPLPSTLSACDYQKSHVSGHVSLLAD